MKKLNIVAFSVAALALTACGSNKIDGTYSYKGWNGLANAEEIWTLVIEENKEYESNYGYTLSFANDFLNAKYHGEVIVNEETYTLRHVSSEDPEYPYPAICYGFVAVDEEKTDYRCEGQLDLENKVFTPLGLLEE